MNLSTKLMSYSISNQLKWALLWIRIGRFAYRMGDPTSAYYAHRKGKAAYRDARRILRQSALKGGRLKSLVTDLETVP